MDDKPFLNGAWSELRDYLNFEVAIIPLELQNSVIFVTKIKTRTLIIGLCFKKTRTIIIIIIIIIKIVQ